MTTKLVFQRDDWLIIGVTLLFVAWVGRMSTLLMHNMASITLNHEVTQKIILNEVNSSGLYGLLHGRKNSTINVWYLLMANDYELAALDWKTFASQEDALIQVDWLFQQGSLTTASAWWQLAYRTEAPTQEVWFWAGKLCQANPSGEFCTLYLDHHQQNWLINSDFEMRSDGWIRTWLAEVVMTHDVLRCNEFKCAYSVLQDTAVSKQEYSLAWSQCLVLLPNTSYTFSSWIKVNTYVDSTWRPVYVQGIENGQPKGIWPSTQLGSQDWNYYEVTIDADSFTEPEVCFYPVRLFASGELFFHSPQLVSNQYQKDE